MKRAGHSAGGQYVTRYEMANRIHETLGLPVSYVVANPSSYAWLDTTRPVTEDDKTTFRNFGDGRARGEAFAKLLTEKYGAKHATMIVHLCGHNARCMFTSEEALPVLFPKN